MRNNLTIAALCLFLTATLFAATRDDAYIKSDGTIWVLGTSSVEKTLALEHGMLVIKSFKDKVSGHELSTATSTGPWRLVHSKTSKLKQGELELDLTLQRDSLAVTKTYVVYPGSSIILEWSTLTNAGTTPVTVSDPELLNTTVRLGDSTSTDFHWMAGGADQPGNWLLKTERLVHEKPRTFDSYDPFPRTAGTCVGFGNNLPNAAILLNGKTIWPARDWLYLPLTARAPAPFDLPVELARGDKLTFLTTTSSLTGGYITAFDLTIVYEDGETHTASREFSNQQGRNNWRYQLVDKGSFVDLSYDPLTSQWHKENNMLFVGQDDQQGNYNNQAAARVWTVSKPGRARIIGSICGPGKPETRGFHAGSSSYAPWVALVNRKTKQGLFIGWDYFGHWTSSYTLNPDDSVAARLNVAGHHQVLPPGQSVTTPKAFVGLFRGDLDDAGNELLDWQYRYLWDYTRDDWFPAVRMIGNWSKGTCWEQQNGGDSNCRSDYESTFREIFRMADLIRYTGADVYHRDNGWWDRPGDWNGPDFRTTGVYLHKSGIGQLIYVMPYYVDFQSRVAREHPDWVLGNKKHAEGAGTLDMSRPEVVAFIKGQLNSFVTRWGDFEWRDDAYMSSPKDHDDTVLLGQDHGMRDIMTSFLDKHPRSAFQAVNGGGIYAGVDYARYASSITLSDASGGVMRGNYWSALLLPPDKAGTTDGIWNIDRYDKTIGHGLLDSNFPLDGDTQDPSKLEGVRQLIDIYHYLQSQGVVGRWVHVYRPIVAGDDPALYFERLGKDGKRGIIIPKRPALKAVMIKPKGLLPNEKYVVSYQESGQSGLYSGADLMEKGITLDKMLPGELIYLNLPLHPGSKLDTERPLPPPAAAKHRGENMGYPGIELTWKHGSDNNWISYYEIIRNGVAIDKVAKGTFYFDHSAGADLAASYEVQTVDGAGNISASVSAQGPAAEPSRIVDDAPGAGITFSSQWVHGREQPWVAFNGTITSTNKKGATAELTFEGKRVLWFSKLGPANGNAAVSVDGGPPEIVDTYSADNIWGVAVYRKEFPAVGRHTIRIKVLGERNAHPAEQIQDTFVYVDGIRVEMQ